MADLSAAVLDAIGREHGSSEEEQEETEGDWSEEGEGDANPRQWQQQQ